MSFSDPIADMIVRIRNAQMRGKESVLVPFSCFKERILMVLQSEGYIHSKETFGEKPQEKVLKVFLKYLNGKPVIRHMKRVSKPSVQYYTSLREMKPVCNGLGISVLSTSSGVMSDVEARARRLGGKIIMQIS